MTAIFITVLNMSITASIVALAVILVRILLKKAPKIFSYALWGCVVKDCFHNSEFSILKLIIFCSALVRLFLLYALMRCIIR